MQVRAECRCALGMQLRCTCDCHHHAVCHILCPYCSYFKKILFKRQINHVSVPYLEFPPNCLFAILVLTKILISPSRCLFLHSELVFYKHKARSSKMKLNLSASILALLASTGIVKGQCPLPTYVQILAGNDPSIEPLFCSLDEPVQVFF